jgi:hypothetical protein
MVGELRGAAPATLGVFVFYGLGRAQQLPGAAGSSALASSTTFHDPSGILFQTVM